MLRRMRVEHGLKLRVHLNRYDPGGILQQRKGERADTRPDLEHTLVGTQLGQSADALDHMVVDEEVLSQAVFGGKAEFLEQVARRSRIGQR